MTANGDDQPSETIADVGLLTVDYDAPTPNDRTAWSLFEKWAGVFNSGGYRLELFDVESPQTCPDCGSTDDVQRLGMVNADGELSKMDWYCTECGENGYNLPLRTDASLRDKIGHSVAMPFVALVGMIGLVCFAAGVVVIYGLVLLYSAYDEIRTGVRRVRR